MKSLYCKECGEYLMAGSGSPVDCACGWKQPEDEGIGVAEYESLQAECEELMHEYKQQLEAQEWLLKQCQELLKQEKVSCVELDCYLEGTMPVEDLVRLYKSGEKQ